MIFRLYFCILLLSASFCAFAQDNSVKATSFADFSVGVSSRVTSGAFSWVRLHPLGRRGNLKLGYGIRFTSAFTHSGDFITAPSLLTSGQDGPQVLFIPTKEKNLDTLTVPSTQFYSLNAAFYLEYALSSKWDIGLNLDVVGFTFGPSASGTFHSSIYSPTVSQQAGKPTAFNILLGSDTDHGSLNSEFYTSYHLSPRVVLRVGASFLFNELTTDQKLSLDNDRFRLKSLGFFASVRYRLFAN